MIMKKRDKTAVLSREFRNFVADIETLLKETAELTGDELSEAREKLQERVAEARESVVDISSDLARKARKTVARANREVHEEPWKAIGTGAAIGLLLGLLFSRR
jgi:ElaB/YqjD/DUF883 family membrane-anchored ribosome-binding protein